VDGSLSDLGSNANTLPFITIYALSAFSSIYIWMALPYWNSICPLEYFSSTSEQPSNQWNLS